MNIVFMSYLCLKCILISTLHEYCNYIFKLIIIAWKAIICLCSQFVVYDMKMSFEPNIHHLNLIAPFFLISIKTFIAIIILLLSIRRLVFQKFFGHVQFSEFEYSHLY